MKSNKKLEKRVERIYALRAKGLTIAKIAEKVGLTEGGVSYHLNK